MGCTVSVNHWVSEQPIPRSRRYAKKEKVDDGPQEQEQTPLAAGILLLSPSSHKSSIDHDKEGGQGRHISEDITMVKQKGQLQISSTESSSAESTSKFPSTPLVVNPLPNKATALNDSFQELEALMEDEAHSPVDGSPLAHHLHNRWNPNVFLLGPNRPNNSSNHDVNSPSKSLSESPDIQPAYAEEPRLSDATPCRMNSAVSRMSTIPRGESIFEGNFSVLDDECITGQVSTLLRSAGRPGGASVPSLVYITNVNEDQTMLGNEEPSLSSANFQRIRDWVDYDPVGTSVQVNFGIGASMKFSLKNIERHSKLLESFWRASKPEDAKLGQVLGKVS